MTALQMEPETRPRAPSREEEARLIREAQADPARFGALFDRHFDSIYRFAFAHLGGDAATAADIAQDTFLRALRALPQYRVTDRPFSAWLYRIAMNLLRNRAARTRPTAELREAELLAPSARPEETWLRVFELARQLPDPQREVLLLRLSQGLSNDQVAQVIDRSVSAAKAMYVRALRTLRRLAKERGIWK